LFTKFYILSFIKLYMKINLFQIFFILGVVSFLIVPYIAGAYDSYIWSKKPTTCNLEKIDLKIENITTTKDGITYTLTEEYFKSLESYKSIEEFNNKIDENGCLKEEAKQEELGKVREQFNQLPFIIKYKSRLSSSLIYWYFWAIPVIFIGLALYVNNKR